MRIALIEDNIDLARGIVHSLGDAGHAVDHLTDGIEAVDFLSREGADLVVLDINLPGQSGLDVLRALRQRQDQTPVLLLTARSNTEDRVAGLDAGADDYLVKPFAIEELMARLRALARRRVAGFSDTQDLGPLKFDRTARQLLDRGTPVELPRKELAAFECLLERRGRLTPKSTLVSHLYGVGADVDDSLVEAHISRLRKRLRRCGVEIKTARGLGYMLVEPE
ncbi:MAG: response regulator transcription factor [Pseudomonadota bacterium]